MLRSRLFEEAVARLWAEGAISGEMHLGLGEEGIAAGVVTHLRDGDALALDHRGTPPLLMRGLDPVLLLKELLGRPDGLCGGRGGHMHLFAPALLAVSSGIVGSSGPAAAGFALAARQLRPGSLAVGFFGEGAMNQGMLLESLNLAAAWSLPVLFVCKDSRLAITTLSAEVTGGSLLARAQAFGLAAAEVDGAQVLEVFDRVGEMLERLRQGQGPCFLLARCLHLEGHMLGDQVLRAARAPLKEMRSMAGGLVKAALAPRGGTLRQRVAGAGKIGAMLRASRQDREARTGDPVAVARERLEAEPERLARIEEEARQEILRVVREACQR
jgi:pyruvate dehydrogenase E1 component alpha subunit